MEKTHDDNLGRDVSWSVLWAEGLRANDVSNTVSDQVHRSYSRLLGVTSYVAGNETEQSDERRRGSLSKIVSKQAPNVVVEW